MTLHISVRSKALARILYNVNNTYETVLHTASGNPLLQNKVINGTRYSNIFSDNPVGFFDEFGFFYPTKQTPHTLFSLFRIIAVTKPSVPQTFTAISCNTRWDVTVTPQPIEQYIYQGKSIPVKIYLLTFKSLDPHSVLKNRYDDILDKELFWNSGVVRCAIDTEENLMYEARLISAKPEVAIHLTGTMTIKE